MAFPASTRIRARREDTKHSGSYVAFSTRACAARSSLRSVSTITAISALNQPCHHARVQLRLDDTYELDDDPGRVDVDALVAFLTTSAYWGRWRGRTEIEAQLASAWRVVGLYSGEVMVGFAR